MRKLVHAVLLGGCGLVALGSNPAVAQQPKVISPRYGAGTANNAAERGYGSGYNANEGGGGAAAAAAYGGSDGNGNPANYATPATEPLTWLDNVDAALQQAAAQQRLVLVHFWSDNCPPCVGVERNVLSRPDVQQAIQTNFIAVKIKVDNQPRVAERFRIDRWPTDLVLMPDGQELVRSVSSQDPGRYRAFLARAAAVLNNANNVAAHVNNAAANVDNAAANAHRSAQAFRGQFAAFQQDASRNAQMAGFAAANAAQQTAQQAANTAASATQEFANNASAQVNAAAGQFSNQIANQFPNPASNPNANAPGAVANPYGSPAAAGAPTVGPGGYGMPPASPPPPPATGGGRFLPQAANAGSAFQPPGGNLGNAPEAYAAPQNGSGNAGRFAATSPASPPPAYAQPESGTPGSGASPFNVAANQGPSGVASGPAGNVNFGRPATGGAGFGGAAGQGAAGQGAAGQGAIGQGGGSPFAPGLPSPQTGFRSPRSGIAPAGTSTPVGGGGVEPPKSSALGLEGFCPVTLFETRKWRRADARWGVVHRDRTYLFAGPEQQRKFLEDPDRYAPMLSGYDPVRYLEQGQLVEGRRQHGLWYRNQMFLFADEASLEQFWKNAEDFAPRVEQAMQRPATGGPIRR